MRIRTLLLITLLLTSSYAAIAQCSGAAAGAVLICSPANGATVSSPVNVQAAASAPAGQVITAMRLYIDSVAKFTSSSGTLSTSQAVANGSHTLVVNAWTNTGAVFSSRVTITVGIAGITVTVSPSSAQVQRGGTQQFTATVQNASDPTVTWSVDGVAGGNSTIGTISSTGLYAAPSTAGQHTVRATSVMDQTKSGSATVAVVSQSPCSPSPSTVTICSPAAGSTVPSPVTFQAVAGAPAGQVITAMRLYIDSVAKFTSSSGTLNTSQALPNGSHSIAINAWTNKGTVFSARETISVGVSGPSVTISPRNPSAAPGATVQFSAAVQNSANTSVVWFVDNVQGGNSTSGTISASGLYTAPPTGGNHTVRVALATQTAVSDSTTVTVTTTPPTVSDVLTSKGDNSRTGANTNESVLTPAAVRSSSFAVRAKWDSSVIDGNIFTQPLYVSGVSIGSGVFNVIYVGTEHGSIYALNADATSTNSAPLWKRSFINPAAGINPAPGNTSGRTGIGPEVSITGTPVIDKSRQVMYVSVMTNEHGQDVHRLHAINLRTGQDVVNAALINPQVSGTGSGSSGGVVKFNPTTQNQRAGLLLVNGVVYVAFASFSDIQPYHGWVLAYDANNLSLIDALNVSANTEGGGIWQSGSGLAADSDGNVYVVTGDGCNGNWSPSSSPGGTCTHTGVGQSDSILKVRLVNGNLTVVDFFTPFNEKCLDVDDLDLGSAGALLLPNGLAGRDMLVSGAKEGRIYLVDRNNMGKKGSTSDAVLDSKLINAAGACGGPGFNANSSWRIYGAAAYWNGTIYIGSAFGPLRRYNVSGGTLSQMSLSAHIYAASGQSGRGPIPVVSSNGNSNAIVWTVERDLSGAGWLRAYDATNLGTQLLQTSFGGGTVFTVPTVTAGRVYLTGGKVIFAYGIR